MNLTLRTYNLLRQLPSFALVGLITNLIVFGFYLLLFAIRLDPKFAATLLYFSGVVLSIFVGKWLAFQYKDNFFFSGICYLCVYGIGHMIYLSFMSWMIDYLVLLRQIVQIVAICSFAAVLFIMLRMFALSSVHPMDILKRLGN